jgi:hypothetical protein
MGIFIVQDGLKSAVQILKKAYPSPNGSGKG